MIALAYHSWRLAWQAIRVMPETFISASILACALTAGQYELTLHLATAMAPHPALYAALLAVPDLLMRAVFIAPLAWAVHRWVLLREEWNDIALPRLPGQRAQYGWITALGLLGSLPLLPLAVLLDAHAPIWVPITLSNALLALGVLAGVRVCLTGPAISLDISNPVRTAWRLSRGHAWFTGVSMPLTCVPLMLIEGAGLLCRHFGHPVAGVAMTGVNLALSPVILSSWQANLYALLRGEGAVPADEPVPAPEQKLLQVAWQSLRLAARAAVALAPLLLAACLITAAGNFLVLQYITRQHFGLGGSGSFLQDYGWRGVGWIALLIGLQAVLTAYAGAAVLRATQRLAHGGERGGLLSLLPSRALLPLIALLLPFNLAYVISVAALFSYGVMLGLLGLVSTELTLLLLLVPVIWTVIWLLRLSLIAAPLALGRRFAAAESRHISEGHAWYIGAAYALLLLPAAAGRVWLYPRVPGGQLAREVAYPAATAVLLALLAGAVCAYLYRKLQTGLPEQDRPSRNRLRRREPALNQGAVSRP
jgi:hypothetical protein